MRLDLYSYIFNQGAKVFGLLSKKIGMFFIFIIIFFFIKFIDFSNVLKVYESWRKINLSKINYHGFKKGNVGREDIGEPIKALNTNNQTKDFDGAQGAISLQKNNAWPLIQNIYSLEETRSTKYSNQYNVWSKSELRRTGYWNFRKFSDKEFAGLSILGQRLYLHEDIGRKSTKQFLIYIYKFGKRLERRLVKHFKTGNVNPFENCAVHNCRLSYNHSDFHISDAVLFHLHLLQGPPTHLERKNTKQRWVWLSDESPSQTFLVAQSKNIQDYNNFFNWSMTYRAESDVPVPYGRTVPFPESPYSSALNPDIYSTKNKTIAILGSNCSGRNGRWNFVKKLQKYIEVDMYGHCGVLKCPGHFDKDCTVLQSYKFYLAFENDNCKDYITEKVWWNALAKESVPIVMGPTRENYEQVLPPNSFIHVDDFNSAEDLAQYLKFLLTNKQSYNKYHAWRTKYRALNEHGYFGTNVFHYCRLCEALNFNSPLPKTYHNMEAFWNKSRDCIKHVY